MVFVGGRWWSYNGHEDIIWANGSIPKENVTDLVPPISSSCALYVFIITGVLCSIYTCFGLVGNILGLVALTKVQITPSTLFLLRCIAAVDIFYLCAYFIAACIPEIAYYFNVSILVFRG